MKNIKIPVSDNFFVSFILMMCLLTKWEGIIFAFMILAFCENKKLRRMMIRVLVVVFLFDIISVGAILFDKIMGLIFMIITVPFDITTLVKNAVTIVEYTYITVMAIEALKGRVFTCAFVENLVDVVYQSDKSDTEKNTYCILCGSILGEDDLFCQKCGTKRQ